MEIIHTSIETSDSQDLEKLTVRKILTWIGYVLASPIAALAVIPIVLFHEAALVYVLLAAAWERISDVF
jgi:hypothetical protein